MFPGRALAAVARIGRAPAEIGRAPGARGRARFGPEDQGPQTYVQTFWNTIDPSDPESYPPGTAWDLTNSEIVESVVRLELADYAWTEDARAQWYIKQTIQTQVPPALAALCKRAGSLSAHT